MPKRLVQNSGSELPGRKRKRNAEVKTAAPETDIITAHSKTKKHCRTVLQQAVQEGVLPKARRACQLFTSSFLRNLAGSTNANRPSSLPAEAAEPPEVSRRPDFECLKGGFAKAQAAWKALPASEKEEWQKKSADEFAARRAAAAAAGLHIRWCARAHINKKQDQCKPQDRPSTAAGAAAKHLQMVGPYKLSHSLGSGTYGTVMAATDTLTCRQVAIKLFAPTESGRREVREEVAIYKRLARSLPMSGHSFLLRLLDAACSATAALPYIAMEQGPPSLSALLKQARLMPADVRAIGRQLHLGVKHMHSSSVLHLDIKPSNVLYSTTNKCLHLVDLGFAETLPLRQDLHPSYVTANYRAPELWHPAEMSRVLGRPVDCWSIGCTIFEAAAGTLLFPTANVQLGVRKWCQLHGSLSKGHSTPVAEEDSSLAGRWGLLPTCFRQAVLACCSPAPADRPEVGSPQVFSTL